MAYFVDRFFISPFGKEIEVLFFTVKLRFESVKGEKGDFAWALSLPEDEVQIIAV